MTNAIYHIYNQGVNKETLFRDEQDHRMWLGLLEEITHKLNCHVYCFVTMRNHYHCLIETIEANVSKVLWHLGYYFAKYLNKKYSRVGHLYRNRCQSQLVVDLKYFQTTVWYIHHNPVAAGLIKDVRNIHPFVFTSYHDLAGLTNRYSWLSKELLFQKLEMALPDTTNEVVIWNPVHKEDYMELTKIENISQKMSKLV
jgi:REP element-mobilizing transposase RayT